MTSASSPRQSDGFAARAALYYACLLVVTGIHLPFFPLWLTTRGLDPAAIGVVIAAPMLVRVLAAPIVTRAADHRGALRGALIATTWATALAFVAVASSRGFAAILATVMIAAFFYAPSSALIDAYTLKGLGLRGLAYGPVRLWGSVAFIAANLGAGLALRYLDAGMLIWLIVAALGVTALAALALPRVDNTVAPPAKRVPASAHHWWSARFLGLTLGASLVQASHAVYYGFSAVDWVRHGLDTLTVGSLWGLGVAAEVGLFAVSGRLFGSVNPMVLVGIGACGAIVRWAAMACDPPVILLVPLQCLHALSFAATHLGSVQFIARTAPERREAAAQGDFAMILACTAAAATGGAGLLYAAAGDLAYAGMAVLAACGGALAYMAGRSLPRPRD